MKKVIVPILMLTFGLSAWAQTDRLDSLLYEVVWNNEEMRMALVPPSSNIYLYGGVGAENNLPYAGSGQKEQMVAMSGTVFFIHSSGLFFGASENWYDDPFSGYNNIMATGGISTFLNAKKSLNFQAWYSRYFYSNINVNENYYFNNLVTAISLRNKWIGGRLSVNLFFGQDFDVHFTPSVFSRLPIVRFGKYNKIQFEPEFSAFIGSKTGEPEMILSTSGSQESTSENAYGLVNTRLHLPVCFYIGNFDIELGYSVTVLSVPDENTDYSISSFISFSIGYMLPLK